MKKSYSILIVSLVAFVFASCNQNKAKDRDNTVAENWVQLFNGKDLDGWTVKIKGYDLGENFGNTFLI